jgi:hypothetical protein
MLASRAQIHQVRMQIRQSLLQKIETNNGGAHNDQIGRIGIKKLNNNNNNLVFKKRPGGTSLHQVKW